MAARTGDIKSQQDLVKHLFSMRTAAIYDLFGQTLLHNFFKEIAAGKADATTLIATLPEGTLSLRDFVAMHDRISAAALRETKRNANRALTRNLFKETFRLTLSYCEFSDQKEAIKSEHWFQFARVVANSLSHNFRLDFRPYDLSVLPWTYSGHTEGGALTVWAYQVQPRSARKATKADAIAATIAPVAMMIATVARKFDPLASFAAVRAASIAQRVASSCFAAAASTRSSFMLSR